MDDSSCRVCLKRASNKSLLVFNEVNDIPIVEKLKSVTGIIINQDDPFSKFLCLKCFTDTNTGYDLKSRCLVANRTLMLKLKLQNQFQSTFVSDETVKAEPIDAHLDPIVFIEPVAIKAEFIDDWTQPIGNVNCLDVKLEDTREEITMKQVTSKHAPKRKKTSFSRTKKSHSKRLDNHLQTAHVNGFQCSVCKTNLPSLQSLTAHINEHEAKNIDCCTEINCDYSTESEKELSNHIVINSNVSNRNSEHSETFDRNEMSSKQNKLMPCVICGKLIRSRRMGEHKAYAHFKITRFECDFCSKKFYLKKMLRNHLQKHIPEEFRSRPYECEICNQNFYKIYHLRRHKSLKHVADESEFPCHCGKTFKHQHYLEHHIKYVHQQEKSVCNICGKSYSGKSKLRRHIKINHTRNYQKKSMCNICGVSFHGQSEVNRHQKSVHGEKIFVCEYPGCEKGFSLHDLLTKHEKNSHLKTKSFFCSEPNCNKSFIKKDSLVRHIKILHEKIRDNCPVGNGCKFSVGRITNMRNHLKKHSELSRKELDKYLEIIKKMSLV